MYPRDAGSGSTLSKSAVDDDTSSEEKGSCYEEEEDWNMDKGNEDAFMDDDESRDADGAAKALDVKDDLVEQDD